MISEITARSRMGRYGWKATTSAQIARREEAVRRRTGMSQQSLRTATKSEKTQSNRGRLALQKPAPLKADSQAVAVRDARNELISKLAETTCKITGTSSHDVADRIIHQVANAHVWPKPRDVDDHIIKAIATMAEMAPQNATEAMLAVQMIATHEAGLMFLKRATTGQYVQQVDANVLHATRLMRVFNEQLEAMQRLKGKAGQQKVTVEHVHVHEGGKAVVGAVSVSNGQLSTPGGGEGSKGDAGTITP
jgi:hypothetical protein